MINLALGDDGDIYTQNYRLARVSGNEQIAQRISTRLKLLSGEWFLDTGQGVPWFEQILVKNPNRAIVQGALKRAILQTPGVNELVSFHIDENSVTRKIVVYFAVTTNNGETFATGVEMG